MYDDVNIAALEYLHLKGFRLNNYWNCTLSRVVYIWDISILCQWSLFQTYFKIFAISKVLYFSIFDMYHTRAMANRVIIIVLHPYFEETLAQKWKKNQHIFWVGQL